MPISTADLCDQYPDEIGVAEPVLTDFGGIAGFDGSITTVRVFEDNVLVRDALEEPGDGRVLVIDGGGSLRCALLGDRLAGMALANGWSGIVVNGCIRDAAALSEIAVGIRALATHPRKSAKTGDGERDVEVTFAGVTFVPGQRLYADHDGVLVAARAL